MAKCKNPDCKVPHRDPTGPEPMDLESFTFTCPRCKQEVTERLYGPCSECRGDVRWLSSEGELHDVNREFKRQKEAETAA